MNEQDLKIDLGAVAETLVIPLWARAKDAEKKDPILNDTYAKDIVAKIDYDFSKIETKYMENHQLVWTIRAYNFENCGREFIKNKNNAMVINIGAGLDTTFKRVDNGSVLWINVELPDVAALRQKLILADAYPSAHVLFDAMSRFTVWLSNRAILKKSGMDSSARLKWHLKRASGLRRWVDTIKIIEEYPMFSRVPIKQEWSKKLIWDIKIAGRLRLYNMVLIQV